MGGGVLQGTRQHCVWVVTQFACKESHWPLPCSPERVACLSSCLGNGLCWVSTTVGLKTGSPPTQFLVTSTREFSPGVSDQNPPDQASFLVPFLQVCLEHPCQALDPGWGFQKSLRGDLRVPPWLPAVLRSQHCCQVYPEEDSSKSPPSPHCKRCPVSCHCSWTRSSWGRLPLKTTASY